MQDSQLRGLIGLSLVVVILVGLLSLPADQESAHGDDATQVLNLPDLSAVVEIKLVRPDDTVKLSLDESVWTVVSPYHAAADQAVVDRVGTRVFPTPESTHTTSRFSSTTLFAWFLNRILTHQVCLTEM